MLADALPWTICLLLTTTLIAFGIGTLLGAILGWPRAPRWLAFALPPLIALHALPFFLLGLILIYLVTTNFPFFPLFGGYSPGSLPQLKLDFILDVLRHAILPATSIVLVSVGGWALGASSSPARCSSLARYRIPRSSLSVNSGTGRSTPQHTRSVPLQSSWNRTG